MKPFLLLLLLTAPLLAQKPATPAPSGPATGWANRTNQKFFGLCLPGGKYYVAVRAILAVTSHEYLVDGVARVTEVNIDTAGSLVARFYFIEPNTPNTPSSTAAAVIEKTKQLVQEAAERTEEDAWKKVQKNYPTTTHARTVEYRVMTKDALWKIRDGAMQAFTSGETVEMAADGAAVK